RGGTGGVAGVPATSAGMAGATSELVRRATRRRWRPAGRAAGTAVMAGRVAGSAPPASWRRADGNLPVGAPATGAGIRHDLLAVGLAGPLDHGRPSSRAGSVPPARPALAAAVGALARLALAGRGPGAILGPG